ncbi:hypothetical protein K7432_003364 [Basidiobolus ranarum]|uniref:Yeast cell wall synthesis Kre9/Knh1-like N-terminal domain-containing protein n=1 Tax=Basidiobolus ranarum TaxID=34480 RepID=A0ABR2WZZ1_9FUNG
MPRQTGNLLIVSALLGSAVVDANIHFTSPILSTWKTGPITWKNQGNVAIPQTFDLFLVSGEDTSQDVQTIETNIDSATKSLEYTLPADLPQGSYALRAGRGDDAVYIPQFDVIGTSDSHSTKSVTSATKTSSTSSEVPTPEASSHISKATDVPKNSHIITGTSMNCTFRAELYQNNSNNYTRNMYHHLLNDYQINNIQSLRMNIWYEEVSICGHYKSTFEVSLKIPSDLNDLYQDLYQTNYCKNQDYSFCSASCNTLDLTFTSEYSSKDMGYTNCPTFIFPRSKALILNPKSIYYVFIILLSLLL